ncbi:unnamed protein product [Rotaria sordida]|uniref:Uncharacterized protein n=1 Tax=Rotaria sordida TaxID=392033 RepID=A0A819KII2_9BILA|nr:unnamed protein product [Rotaria sordida]CAF1394250.1 unnamed protein product [Rotaria sordida]CAF3945212.1 unnamed protein product [Rotaria sordida]CAF4041608.1 unnamed protein product [Rotaria sordida]
MASKDVIISPTLLREAQTTVDWSFEDHPQLLNMGILKVHDSRPIAADEHIIYNTINLITTLNYSQPPETVLNELANIIKTSANDKIHIVYRVLKTLGGKAATKEIINALLN